MKKILFIIVTSIMILAIIFICNLSGKTDKTEETYETGLLFEDDDIQSAIREVKREFRTTCYGCTMNKLWYNESESNKVAESYYDAKINKNNIIVIFTDFKTSNICPQGLSKNTLYEKYNWILVRNNSSEKWKIFSSGY